MTWTVVAKKDFEDAVRAKTLWVLIILFTLVVALASWAFSGGPFGPQNPDANALIISLLVPVALFLPALGVATGYKSIVSERTSGSIKLLLALPHERRDVLLGKFVGRTAVVSAATIVGFLVGGVVFAAMASNFAPAKYFGMLVMTLVLATAFVSVAVGFSASTKSDTLVLVVGIGLVLLFTLLWDIFLLLVAFLLTEVLNMGFEQAMEIRGFLSSLNPANAHRNLVVQWFIDAGESGAVTPEHFWQEPWFALVVLLAWIVVPLAIGYWRFEGAEL